MRLRATFSRNTLAVTLLRDDKREIEAEGLAETEAEVEALKRQWVEIAKFPKLILPCK